MSTLIQEGAGNVPQQTFVKWNDPVGTELVAVNRDGTIYAQGVRYPDGTIQTSVVSGATGPAGANGAAGTAGATGPTGPAGAGLNYRTVRSTATSFTQGGLTIVSLPFVTPFADDNYTVQVTVVGEEVAPETPTVTQFPSAGVAYVRLLTPAGTGVMVWVSNNDSGAHTGYVQVTAIHD